MGEESAAQRRHFRLDWHFLRKCCQKTPSSFGYTGFPFQVQYAGLLNGTDLGSTKLG
ncbi:hypothetical protein GGC03_26155 (plasmid) [Vibrio sp. THAF191c]|nr:hypothetical protein FIU99_26500 [Vibrio sp. THAF64]QGM37550.1 hypothetical protein GGC04_24980 [Vibrio sp. THAF191d]QGN73275.1 hypothetical protein GGC03_26155 [Vibrio sp. THAF191c]